MTDGDYLLQVALACPADGAARGALADWLDENGGAEIAPLVRDVISGPAILRELFAKADKLGRRACLRLLWFFAITYGKMALMVPDSPNRGLSHPPSGYQAMWQVASGDSGWVWRAFDSTGASG